MKEKYRIAKPISLTFTNQESATFSKGILEVENNIIYFINVVGRRYKTITPPGFINDWIEYRFIEEFC